MKIALDNIDAVISTIRGSATAEIARTALMENFKLSQRQAQAILDMRLQRLTGLERKKIDEEYADLLETIDWLESVLADEHKVMNIIKEDLQEMKKRFGDERRTEISIDSSEMDIEDLIAEEDIVVTISHQGYIKRQTLDNFRSQKRGGVAKPVAAARRLMIRQSISSFPLLTITFSSLPTVAVYIARRAMKSPKQAAQPRAQLLSTCWL